MDILDSVGVMVWVVRQDLTFAMVNSTYAEFTGKSASELHGRKILDAFPSESAGCVGFYGKIFETGISGSAEIWRTNRLGELRLLALNCRRTNIAGEPYAVCTAIDKTEQHRSLEAVRDRSNMLQTLLSSIPDIVYFKDTDLRNILVNKAFADFAGCSEQECEGKTDAELLPEELAKHCTDSDKATMKLGSTLRIEERSPGSSGVAKVFETIKTPIFDSEGKAVGLVGMSRNVTEQRATETRLRESLKNEAVLRVAGGVAHDLNNSLQPLVGYSELAMRAGEGNAKLERYLKQILASAERATRMTRQLLAFCKRLPLEYRPLDSRAFLHGLRQSIAETIGDDRFLVDEITDDLPVIEADETHLGQVFNALAENARDFLPRDATVFLRASRCTLQSGDSEVDGILVKFSDSGKGIDEETMEQLFDPFFTTKGFGAGLGLPVARGIVEQHGGRMTAISEPGKGLLLEIRLPCTRGRAPADQHRPAVKRMDPLHILVVENEPLVLRLLHDILNIEGHVIATASSAEDALKLVASGKGPFDLLVSDMMLGEMNGKDLLMALRREIPHIQGIFVSGYARRTVEGMLADCPDAMFITKPFSMTQLLDCVHRAAKALGRDGVS
jgi:PAS domain S-box-containing protein